MIEFVQTPVKAVRVGQILFPSYVVNKYMEQRRKRMNVYIRWLDRKRPAKHNKPKKLRKAKS